VLFLLRAILRAFSFEVPKNGKKGSSGGIKNAEFYAEFNSIDIIP
jgi:hypothetical protein